MKTILVVLNNGNVAVEGAPADIKVEIIDLNLICNDPIGTFWKLSKEGKRLVADEHPHVIEIGIDSSRSKCQSCGRIWCDGLTADVEYLFERVRPGEPMPSGECPICGALCHPVETPSTRMETKS